MEVFRRDFVKPSFLDDRLRERCFAWRSEPAVGVVPLSRIKQ
ncbi:hypothetical protein CHELA20_10385 [Hyphomicrobiales bacterium]|nr:hypothetical protein CHELA20_10385 [Hyphomicrobiales bacterium]CAH1691928.1 hypothetical protein CHELA41_50613 [Hyphomicrobiales bacterium]